MDRVKSLPPVLVTLVVFALAAALWLTQCSGPRPLVAGEPLVHPPDQPGQPFRAEAAIRNAGPGHGQVQVVFRLEDRKTGQSYQRTEAAQLESGEETRMVVEVWAPPGEYTLHVQAQYPPG